MAIKGAISQGIFNITGLLVIFIVKVVNINDDCGTGLHPLHVGFEGSRVKGNQHICEVARSVYFLVADVQLKT